MGWWPYLENDPPTSNGIFWCPKIFSSDKFFLLSLLLVSTPQSCNMTIFSMRNTRAVVIQKKLQWHWLSKPFLSKIVNYFVDEQSVSLSANLIIVLMWRGVLGYGKPERNVKVTSWLTLWKESLHHQQSHHWFWGLVSLNWWCVTMFVQCFPVLLHTRNMPNNLS